MDGLTEGRIVHFVFENGEHRPAIVVKVWRITGPGNIQDPPPNGCSNLQVFTDSDGLEKYNDMLPQVMWKTSILFSEEAEPNTWHWIEKA